MSEIQAAAAALQERFGLDAVMERPVFELHCRLSKEVAGRQVRLHLYRGGRKGEPLVYILEGTLEPVEVAARTSLSVQLAGARSKSVLPGIDILPNLTPDLRVFVNGFDERHVVDATDPGLACALLQDERVRQSVVEICYWGGRVALHPPDRLAIHVECRTGLAPRAVPAVAALLRLAAYLEELKDIEPLDVHDVVDTAATGTMSGAPVAIPDVMEPETGLWLKKLLGKK